MKDKHMNFLLEVGKSEVFLSLKQENETFEKMPVGTGRDLMENLLPAIDSLLRKHGLEVGDIKGFEVVSDLPEGYSARRIAETVAAVYSFAVLAQE